MPSSLSSPFLNSRKCELTHIPRPLNSFFLFRTSRLQEIIEQRRITGQIGRQADLSKNLAKEWKGLPQTQKKEWEEKAKREKQLHAEKYPHYQYRPMRRRPRGTKQKKTKKSSDNDSHFYTSGTQVHSRIYGNPPHLDITLPYEADPDHGLALHSPTWLCPPANQSLFHLLNTPLEFMSLDQLAGIALQDICLPDFE